MRLIESAALAILLALPTLAADQDRPTVGGIAPPLGEVYWYDLGTTKQAPTLSELRGDVVLVHTWGYYCDSCVREGVPLLVDVLAANQGAGLHAFSITSLIEDGNPDDHFVGVGREMGLGHALGVADVDGSMTPYLDLGRNKSLTWCFVIGRDGALRWAGDPSSDEEEFLEAVTSALLDRGPEVPTLPSEAFAKAMSYHIAGQHDRVAKELGSVVKRYEKKRKDPGSEAITGAAAAWIERIEAHLAETSAALDGAFEAQDAAAFGTAAAVLERGYPKSDAADRAGRLRKQMSESFETALERWEAWSNLLRARPASFPVRSGKAEKKFAKALQKYLTRASEDAPGVEQAQEWLKRFEDS